MSTWKIEAVLRRFEHESRDADITVAIAEALKELGEVRMMCRSFKELGVGAFREMAQASCLTMDAIAVEVMPLAASVPTCPRCRRTFAGRVPHGGEPCDVPMLPAPVESP